MGSDELYGQSKFAVVVMAKEFARHYSIQTKPAANGEGGEVLSIPVNPGNLKTGLQRYREGVSKILVVRYALYITLQNKNRNANVNSSKTGKNIPLPRSLRRLLANLRRCILVRQRGRRNRE